MADFIMETVMNFCTSIGLSQMPLEDYRSCRLSFESSDALRLDCLDDLLMVSLTKKIHESDLPAAMERALSMCRPENNFTVPVQLGLGRQGELVFTTYLERESISVPSLRQSVDALMDMGSSVL
ncbi:MAG: hypothetical protein HQK54_07825 [Oligoflexales bacterium]|nr:hypothetical protein [Oligoflexales bacterium]